MTVALSARIRRLASTEARHMDRAIKALVRTPSKAHALAFAQAYLAWSGAEDFSDDYVGLEGMIDTLQDDAGDDAEKLAEMAADAAESAGLGDARAW